ncbi:hyalin-like [Amphiura filiformis]|uniref:hyalin-like n=1 Tax=Amphiura filiformis TaxID=82378 RepID=UPI003B213BED
MNCPADIDTTVEEGVTSTNIAWIEPSATDTSKNVRLLFKTHTPGQLFGSGYTSVIYQFVDSSRNLAICNFDINVTGSFKNVDIIPPTIHLCPHDLKRDIEIGSFGAIVDWNEPKATDASNDAMLLVQTHVPGTFFAVGTTIVTYIFKDDANNMERCTFSITVNAVEAASQFKIFNCPSNIVATAESGKNQTFVSWVEPFAIGLSTGSRISSTHRPNDTFGLGSTPVVYAFVNGNGDQQHCNFTVNVRAIDKKKDQDDAGFVKETNRDAQGQAERSVDAIAVAGLVMSLLIVIIAFLVALVLYIRKQRKSECMDLDDYSMSTMSSQNPASKM